MAIKRCPYCRSIIDEVDRYCNNCGTQLLFPEDESIEEDIPGDRILEVDDKLPEDESEIIAREEEPVPPAVPGLEEDELPFMPVKSKEETVIPDLEFPPLEREPEPDFSVEAPRKFATRELPEMEVELPAAPRPYAPEYVETPSEPPKPSEDFEAGFPTSAEESDDIARLISSLEKQAPPKTPPPPPLKEEEEEEAGFAFSEKALPPLRFEEEKPPTEDELPPWAERVKDGVTPGFRLPTEEDLSRELGEAPSDDEPRFEPLAASGVDELTIGDDGFRRAAEPDLKPRLRPRRRGRGPLGRLKARIYDLLLITLFWTAALWASSRVLGVPFFDVILNSALQAGVFYLVLLAGYFALFFSFLGETPGDRLSAPRS